MPTGDVPPGLVWSDAYGWMTPSSTGVHPIEKVVPVESAYMDKMISAFRRIQQLAYEKTILDELYEEEVDEIRKLCEEIVGPYPGGT